LIDQLWLDPVRRQGLEEVVFDGRPNGVDHRHHKSATGGFVAQSQEAKCRPKLKPFQCFDLLVSSRLICTASANPDLAAQQERMESVFKSHNAASEVFDQITVSQGAAVLRHDPNLFASERWQPVPDANGTKDWVPFEVGVEPQEPYEYLAENLG
jgi:hypothetical protein